MKEIQRQTRSRLMELFARHGFHPRTDLGQNFLIDLNLIDFVVEQARVGPGDVVLEIGAGTGGLTAALAASAGHVVSVEVDHRVYGLAREMLAGIANVTLIHADALRTKSQFADVVLETIAARLSDRPDSRLKLVSNLPYCIATPVISNLVASDLPWAAMVVTIQWELAERILAAPASEHYSALSVWLQSQCDVKILKKLGPTVFWPRPQVDSAILRLLPDPSRQAQIADRAFFHDFVRRLFQQRRKYLRSVLVGMYRRELARTEIDSLLQPFGFSESVRAEELEVSTLVQVGNALAIQLRGRSA